jgi:hypothetical protein
MPDRNPNLIRSSDALREILLHHEGPAPNYRAFHSRILNGEIPGATRLQDGTDGRIWWIARDRLSEIAKILGMTPKRRKAA